MEQLILVLANVPKDLLELIVKLQEPALDSMVKHVLMVRCKDLY